MPEKAVRDQEVTAKPQPRTAPPSTGRLVQLCVAAWLVPGLGHFLLRRKWRALIYFVCILALFFLGIAMEGQFFTTGSGSLLQTLGYWGELCVGLVMPATKFFGYSGGDPFFVSSDYGTAYLVAAGMLNVLTILDVYDIAMGRKS